MGLYDYSYANAACPHCGFLIPGAHLTKCGSCGSNVFCTLVVTSEYKRTDMDGTMYVLEWDYRKTFKEVTNGKEVIAFAIASNKKCCDKHFEIQAAICAAEEAKSGIRKFFEACWQPLCIIAGLVCFFWWGLN